MAKLIVEIDEQGNTSLDVVGAEGTSCQDLTKAFARMGKVVKDRKKPEFYKKSGQVKVSRGR
jgi:hypothetical protein